MSTALLLWSLVCINTQDLKFIIATAETTIELDAVAADYPDNYTDTDSSNDTYSACWYEKLKFTDKGVYK